MIKVASTSRTGGVAGAIAHTMRREKEAKVRAIGAGAVNQALKATILARRYLLEDEEPVSVCCVPNFVEIELEGEEKTAVEITIKQDNDGCDESASDLV